MKFQSIDQFFVAQSINRLGNFKSAFLSGKIIRGKGIHSDNYDAYVIDVWKQYYPQAVELKHDSSVYDAYDIMEEIGTGAFGVVHRCVERATG